MGLETGSKFLVYVRHGAVHNPRDIAYCHDDLTERISLSKDGKNQIRRTAQLLKPKGFNFTVNATSPQFRALQSDNILQKELELPKKVIDPRLNDARSPGPFIEGISHSRLVTEFNDDVFHPRWNKYHHETPEDIIDRIGENLNSVLAQLRPEEAALVVTHGAPLGLLFRYLRGGIESVYERPFPPVGPLRGFATILEFTQGNIFVAQQPLQAVA